MAERAKAWLAHASRVRIRSPNFSPIFTQDKVTVKQMSLAISH